MIRATTHQGYQLLHEGALALSQVEGHGMRVDVDYIDRALKSTFKKKQELEAKMRGYDEWRQIRKRHGDAASLTNHDQVGDLLFNVMGYPVLKKTKKGAASTDAEALEKIDLPFVKDFLALAKLDKAHGTYLKGIKREIVGDRIHPVFNLHTVLTFRSSSDSPNFQNFPVRDPAVAKLIRRAFIPSRGCVLCENDYAGIEVKVAACYHKDPVMLSYIRDPSKDMHRDMAAQIYCLTPDWVKANGKSHRYAAKNKFVFPQFYGDFYVTCAQALWDYMERAKLQGPDGEPLRKHLRKHGIKELGPCRSDERPRPGTFENHLKTVENDFWNNRFKEYGRWKKRWYSDYLETGGFDTLTGFRLEGIMRKNAVINYPVQGSAFHCLLWSLIRINKLLRKYKMRSRIAGQIHDSLIGDVRKEELKDYLDLVKQVMVEDIKKAYPWLIVPLDIENELCPENGSWYDKTVVNITNDGFTYETKDKTLRRAAHTDSLLSQLAQDHSHSIQS